MAITKLEGQQMEPIKECAQSALDAAATFELIRPFESQPTDMEELRRAHGVKPLTITELSDDEEGDSNADEQSQKRIEHRAEGYDEDDEDEAEEEDREEEERQDDEEEGEENEGEGGREGKEGKREEEDSEEQVSSRLQATSLEDDKKSEEDADSNSRVKPEGGESNPVQGEAGKGDPPPSPAEPNAVPKPADTEPAPAPADSAANTWL